MTNKGLTMAQMRVNDTATKIQMQNLRTKVNSMKVVIDELLIALKHSNPELILKHTKYVEIIDGRN